LLRIAQDLGTRLRDIPAALNIAERSAPGIVTDLTAAGYAVRQKDSRSCIWRFRFISLSWACSASSGRCRRKTAAAASPD